ncbi:MAG: hypothetical protein WBB23_02065 [Desulforhopalus sp.]
MIVKNSKSTESESQSAGKPFRIPWWINILLATGSYCGLKYIVPELHFTQPFLQSLAQAAPTFAPLATIPFLLLAAKQLYDVDSAVKNDEKPENDQEEKPKR